MALRSTGICFEIVGTKYSNNGRSCSEHRACGALLHVDAVVSIRDVQIQISDVPELALAAHLVVDGQDTCRVGFLKKNLVKHAFLYSGKLARITEIYTRMEGVLALSCWSGSTWMSSITIITIMTMRTIMMISP